MERIRVCVRVRPRRRHVRSQQEAIEYDRDSNAIRIRSDSSNEAMSFRCDFFFSPQTTQVAVFEQLRVRDMVNDAMQGYSATIFAYGMTGSGKSHTIFGSAQDWSSTQRKCCSSRPLS